MPKATGRVPPAVRVTLDELVLYSALDGVCFPAPRWLLLAYADYNGAGYQLRSGLLRMPERLYRNLVDVASQLNGAALRSSDATVEPSN
jgi:hypothetical protein